MTPNKTKLLNLLSKRMQLASVLASTMANSDGNITHLQSAFSNEIAMISEILDRLEVTENLYLWDNVENNWDSIMEEVNKCLTV